MTNYPQELENTLDFIVESTRELATPEFPMHEHNVRQVFGEVLFQQWLSGETDQMPFNEENFSDLLKRAVAMSILDDMIEAGLVDTIENGEGGEVVFVTPLGKALRSAMEEEDESRELTVLTTLN
jgi:hypothetical protein